MNNSRRNRSFIGKTVYGFSFPDRLYNNIKYADGMKDYVGEKAVIVAYIPTNDSFCFEFSNGDFWHYPGKLVRKRLRSKNDPVTLFDFDEL